MNQICSYCEEHKTTMVCPICKRPVHKKCLKAHFEYWSDEPTTHDVSIENLFMLRNGSKGSN